MRISVFTTAVAFLAFAVMHSITVSRAFKRRLAGIVGETFMRAYYRLAFTVFSAVITAVAAYIIYIQPDVTYWHPPLYISLPARIIQLCGVLLLVFAFHPFDPGYFSGIRQARDYIGTGKTGGDIEGMKGGVLVTSGVYGLVRHPMYLGGILIFLFEPELTENSLVLRLLAAAYFIWGGYIEERRFIEDFGDAYREYMKKVSKFNLIKGIMTKVRV